MLLDFTVHQLKGSDIKILSLFNEKLMVSDMSRSQLFIYSTEGLHLSTINSKEIFYDAIWTPRGNIVYTTFSSNKVVVMSETGKVTNIHTWMKGPKSLSISNDGIIYVADWKTGVYQSTDDGVNWSLVFNSTLGWSCLKAIKVATNYSDVFWTVMINRSESNLLRMYNVDRRLSNVKVTWRDIDVPSTNGEQISLPFSSLSHDSNMNIFLSDISNRAVHVLSTNGQFHFQLLSPNYIAHQPGRLTVDKERQLLYIGQREGLVAVFQLKYGVEGD